MARSIASRLAEYLAGQQAFDWSESNCAQFAAGWVRAVECRGVLVPSVRDLAHSRRVLARLGGSLRVAVTEELQRDPVPASMARPGDVVLIQRDGGQTLGLCAGPTAAVLTEVGVSHLPMQATSAAWHIEPAACATA